MKRLIILAVFILMMPTSALAVNFNSDNTAEENVAPAPEQTVDDSSSQANNDWVDYVQAPVVTQFGDVPFSRDAHCYGKYVEFTRVTGFILEGRNEPITGPLSVKLCHIVSFHRYAIQVYYIEPPHLKQFNEKLRKWQAYGVVHIQTKSGQTYHVDESYDQVMQIMGLN